MVMHELRMRLIGLNRKKVILLLSLPAMFLLTVGILNGSLKSDGDPKPDRIHLVASRIHEGPSLKTRSYKLLHTSDPLDKKYDTDKLLLLGQVETKADEDTRDKGERDHSFNELVSSRLSLNRALPDVRHKLCPDKTYRQELPQASVIICFYNEAWSTLLRTVHSVINRTPPHLLYEIVLVDDASDMAHLQTKLAEYVWMIHPNITLLRMANRQGLIRARMYGARAATGQVLVFLDSHCEVNTKWLEPLLDHIADNRRAVAMPVIDIINPATFQYRAASLVKGGFTWSLYFRWDQLPPNYFKDEKSKADPLETPTMAGGLFAIERKFYFDMGQYDKEMDTWGGENLEMSFRIWLCGGRMDIIPCSRVGHIFRKRRPYGSVNGAESTLRNSIRVARVWLDDYIQHFFQLQPVAVALEYGNITERLELKKRLNCKPFSWYLKYIYPDQTIPGESSKQKVVPKSEISYLRKGMITHLESGLCLKPETDGVPVRNTRVILSKCSKDSHDKNEVWKETSSNELVVYKNLCLHVDDRPGKQTYAKVDKCHGGGGSQAWIWKIQNIVFQMYNPSSGKCLVPFQKANVTYLTVAICTSDTNSAFKMVEHR